MFHHDLLLDGEELDPAWPMVIAVHKPVGYVVTAPDDDKILDPKVYDLLPYRCVAGHTPQRRCGESRGSLGPGAGDLSALDGSDPLLPQHLLAAAGCLFS